MPLSFLHKIDRWIGGFLFYILAFPARALARILPPSHHTKPRFVFLKLKGGGSLMIALPSLLGLRRQFPDAEFTLVCAREAEIYARLTGVFDHYIVIDDSSMPRLIITGLRAFGACFHTSLCIDLEPNSWLASLFTMLTCASQRIGFVKPPHASRMLAYSTAIPLNARDPIHVYYDKICKVLDAIPALPQECRETVSALLPKLSVPKTQIKAIALAAFTSDFARERMMPPQTWCALLQRAYGNLPLNILILGAACNKKDAQRLGEEIKRELPACNVTNLAGTYSLAESVARMTMCDEVWAIDSGLLHIARLLGVPNRSFWGPTMPLQRLRPLDGLSEQISYRPFLCSPCVQTTSAPPCRGHNLCMISMAEEAPNLHPSWVKK